MKIRFPTITSYQSPTFKDISKNCQTKYKNLKISVKEKLNNAPFNKEAFLDNLKENKAQFAAGAVAAISTPVALYSLFSNSTVDELKVSDDTNSSVLNGTKDENATTLSSYDFTDFSELTSPGSVAAAFVTTALVVIGLSARFCTKKCKPAPVVAKTYTQDEIQNLESRVVAILKDSIDSLEEKAQKIGNLKLLGTHAQVSKFKAEIGNEQSLAAKAKNHPLKNILHNIANAYLTDANQNNSSLTPSNLHLCFFNEYLSASDIAVRFATKIKESFSTKDENKNTEETQQEKESRLRTEQKDLKLQLLEKIITDSATTSLTAKAEKIAEMQILGNLQERTDFRNKLNEEYQSSLDAILKPDLQQLPFLIKIANFFVPLLKDPATKNSASSALNQCLFNEVDELQVSSLDNTTYDRNPLLAEILIRKVLEFLSSSSDVSESEQPRSRFDSESRNSKSKSPSEKRLSSPSPKPKQPQQRTLSLGAENRSSAEKEAHSLQSKPRSSSVGASVRGDNSTLGFPKQAKNEATQDNARVESPKPNTLRLNSSSTHHDPHAVFSPTGSPQLSSTLQNRTGLQPLDLSSTQEPPVDGHEKTSPKKNDYDSLDAFFADSSHSTTSATSSLLAPDSSTQPALEGTETLKTLKEEANPNKADEEEANPNKADEEEAENTNFDIFA